MLMGAAVILSTIAPVPTFAEFEVQHLQNLRTLGEDVTIYTNSATAKELVDGSFLFGICFKHSASGLYEWTGIETH